MKYLHSVSGKLTPAHRAETVQALADVFRSDKTVSVLEVEFFDKVVEALKATPSQVAGLNAGDVA